MISPNILEWLHHAMAIDRADVRKVRERAARTADADERAALYVCADRIDARRDELIRELNAQRETS